VASVFVVRLGSVGLLAILLLSPVMCIPYGIRREPRAQS